MPGTDWRRVELHTIRDAASLTRVSGDAPDSSGAKWETGRPVAIEPFAWAVGQPSAKVCKARRPKSYSNHDTVNRRKVRFISIRFVSLITERSGT